MAVDTRVGVSVARLGDVVGNALEPQRADRWCAGGRDGVEVD